MGTAIFAVSDIPETDAGLHHIPRGRRVLPSAIIGMLVIYCLRNTSFANNPFGLPELAAGGLVVLLQWKKRNSLLSILCGTVLYMVLITFLG